MKLKSDLIKGSPPPSEKESGSWYGATLMEWDPTLRGEKTHFTALVLNVPSHFLFTFYNMGNLHLNREIRAVLKWKGGSGRGRDHTRLGSWFDLMIFFFSLNSDKFPRAPTPLLIRFITTLIKHDKAVIFIRGLIVQKFAIAHGKEAKFIKCKWYQKLFHLLIRVKK